MRVFHNYAVEELGCLVRNMQGDIQIVEALDLRGWDMQGDNQIVEVLDLMERDTQGGIQIAEVFDLIAQNLSESDEPHYWSGLVWSANH